MKNILLIFFSILSVNCWAQQDSTGYWVDESSKSYGFYLQYNGITKPYLELGLGTCTEGPMRYHYFSKGSFISSEIKIDFTRTVIGPKIGVWASGGVAPVSMGLNVIYYADVSEFDQGSARIRPEFGFGMFNFRTFVGVNIPVMNYRSSREYVNLVTLGAMLYVPVIKKSNFY